MGFLGDPVARWAPVFEAVAGTADALTSCAARQPHECALGWVAASALLCVLAIVSWRAVLPPSSARSDADTLLAFKASGNGTGLESWVAGTDPRGYGLSWSPLSWAMGLRSTGQWAGVTCGYFGAVTRLDLNGSRSPDLTGNQKLTADIGQLHDLLQLTELRLSDTTVTGGKNDSDSP